MKTTEGPRPKPSADGGLRLQAVFEIFEKLFPITQSWREQVQINRYSVALEERPSVSSGQIKIASDESL